MNPCAPSVTLPACSSISCVKRCGTATAFEEEERDHLGMHAPPACEEILTAQYEALQVSTLLFDMERGATQQDESERSAERLSRDYLKQVAKQLKQTQSTFEA